MQTTELQVTRAGASITGCPTNRPAETPPGPGVGEFGVEYMGAICQAATSLDATVQGAELVFTGVRISKPHLMVRIQGLTLNSN